MSPIEDWTLEELQEQAEELRTRINRFRKSLGRFFVHKQELIDLMVVAALAQEPLLLVGPGAARMLALWLVAAGPIVGLARKSRAGVSLVTAAVAISGGGPQSSRRPTPWPGRPRRSHRPSGL